MNQVFLSNKLLDFNHNPIRLQTIWEIQQIKIFPALVSVAMNNQLDF